MAFRRRIRKGMLIFQCKQMQKPLESELNTKGSTKRLLRQNKTSSQPTSHIQEGWNSANINH